MWPRHAVFPQCSPFFRDKRFTSLWGPLIFGIKGSWILCATLSMVRVRAAYRAKCERKCCKCAIQPRHIEAWKREAACRSAMLLCQHASAVLSQTFARLRTTPTPPCLQDDALALSLWLGPSRVDRPRALADLAHQLVERLLAPDARLRRRLHPWAAKGGSELLALLLRDLWSTAGQASKRVSEGDVSKGRRAVCACAVRAPTSRTRGLWRSGASISCGLIPGARCPGRTCCRLGPLALDRRP